MAVVMQEQLAAEDTARRKADDGDVIFVDAVRLGIGADVPHGAGKIERAHLLRIGAKAVAHHKALIAARGEFLGDVIPLAHCAAKLKGAARANEHRALHLALRGEALDVGNEAEAVRTRRL